MNVSGRHAVVTGTIAGESRATAQKKLREAGAVVHDALSKTTDLLVVGGRPGKQKIDKALARGIEVVKWEAVWNGGDGGTVVVAEPPKADSGVRQIGPALAKSKPMPTGGLWTYEIKWDGLRCVATVKGGAVTMQSRSGKSDYVSTFPQIAMALSDMPDCVVDGELVVLDENGHSDMSFLGGRRGEAVYVMFDVLELEGDDVRTWPLTDRRDLLERLSKCTDDETLQMGPVFDDGERLLDYVRQNGLEGLVAKRFDEPYREGSRDWIKVKVRNEQEFVIVGWKPGEGARAGTAGSILLAVNDDGPKMTYVGRVGTGTDLWEQFAKLPSQAEAPVETEGMTRAFLRDVTWIPPLLVVQVRFQRWTEDGKLMHPSLVGVRTDKEARDVTRAA